MRIDYRLLFHMRQHLNYRSAGH